MRDIDYNVLLKNINEIVNALEFDGMRSGGKIKINAQTLTYLYQLQDRYSKLVKKPVTTTPKKEG